MRDKNHFWFPASLQKTINYAKAFSQKAAFSRLYAGLCNRTNSFTNELVGDSNGSYTRPRDAFYFSIRHLVSIAMQDKK